MAPDSRYWHAFERHHYDRAGFEAPVMWVHEMLSHGPTVLLARLSDEELDRSIANATGRSLRQLRLESLKRRKRQGGRYG